MPDYRAPGLRLSLTRDVHFHRELEPALDRATRDPFDFTGWTGRMDLVDVENSLLVVEFATWGEAGTITLGDQGDITLDMAADIIAALGATVEVPDVSHGSLVGDLVLTSPEGNPFVAAAVVAEITRGTGS